MSNVDTPQLSVARSRTGVWTVTFSNPPINMLDDATIDELRQLLLLLEQSTTSPPAIELSSNR